MVDADEIEGELVLAERDPHVVRPDADAVRRLDEEVDAFVLGQAVIPAGPA
jgi:hypothetical protein